jgi:hypothetical protein
MSDKTCGVKPVLPKDVLQNMESRRMIFKGKNDKKGIKGTSNKISEKIGFFPKNRKKSKFFIEYSKNFTKFPKNRIFFPENRIFSQKIELFPQKIGRYSKKIDFFPRKRIFYQKLDFFRFFFWGKNNFFSTYQKKSDFSQEIVFYGEKLDFPKILEKSEFFPGLSDFFPRKSDFSSKIRILFQKFDFFPRKWIFPKNRILSKKILGKKLNFS